MYRKKTLGQTNLEGQHLLCIQLARHELNSADLDLLNCKHNTLRAGADATQFEFDRAPAL